MDTEIILRARAALGNLTPLSTDCGALCGAACCREDEDGQGGVYLFPGEETLYNSSKWCALSQDSFGTLLTCLAPCPREERPLGCRIFPLTPVFSVTKGVWTVRMDARARAMCPLAPSGVSGVLKPFAAAARDAVRIIAEDSEGEAFLNKWQQLEEQFRGFRL